MTEQDIKKMREMMEFLVKQKISEKLKHLSETERRIYELTGERGQTEIVKSLNVSPNTVSKVWQKLESEGILIKQGKIYRKLV